MLGRGELGYGFEDYNFNDVPGVLQKVLWVAIGVDVIAGDPKEQ